MNEKMKTDRIQQFEIFKRVEKEAERFFAQRETGKALPVWERRPLRKIGEQGLGAEAAIDLFVKEYSEGLALNSGPRFFGYVIGGVTPAALAGDWLTSLYDQNAFGEMDCMDRQIEDEATEGLKDMLGLRSDFTGSFTSGATMATTNALACAREWAAIRQGKTANDGIYGLERPVVLSAFAHASIYKGLSILGLGRNSIIEYGKLPGRDRGDVKRLEEELQKVSHRPYNTGFYFGRPQPEGGAGPVTQTMEYTADVESASDGWVTLIVKNRFFTGDEVEALTPRGVFPIKVLEIRDADTGEALTSVSGAGRRVRIPCGLPLEAGDFIRGINRNHQV